MATIVDGVGSSQALDTSGEIVDLKGLDISSLLGAPANWEHESKLPSQVIGKIIEAHKVFSEEDCKNSRHKYYWNKIHLPFLYCAIRLFDEKENLKPSAVEAAALFKDDAAHPNEPPMVGFSIEGAKLGKTGSVITHSIARKLTVTCIPANKTCVAEMVPNKKASKDDDIGSLFKGELELFQFEPTYIELLEKKEKLKKDNGGLGMAGTGNPAFVGTQLAMDEHEVPPSRNELNEPRKLVKALDAGSSMAAPSQLVGGAALGKESLEKPKKMHKKEKSKWFERADQAYSTWDKKNDFRSYMKKRMPHLAEGEVDSIGRVLALRKAIQAENNLSKMYSGHLKKDENLEKALVDKGKTPHQKAADRTKRNDRVVTETHTFHPSKVGKLFGQKADVRIHERGHSAGTPYISPSLPGHKPVSDAKSTHTRKIVGTPSKSMTKSSTEEDK